MASCSTPQFGNSQCVQLRLTVTESSSTILDSTLSWKLEFVAHGYPSSTSYAKEYTAVVAGETVASGAYDINGKTSVYTIASGTKKISKTRSQQTIGFSCSMAFNMSWNGEWANTKSASGTITIGALKSSTVTYNANGGSGAPSTQTKWAGEILTLSSTTPTRNGYTFQGWSTSNDSSVEYSAGAQYGFDESVTLYAVWKAHTYIVSYNANGGTGAPGNQTKTHDQTLKLSTTKPTRTNYNFMGWGTSASSTTVAYASGANYTSNSAITLYAIWELAYISPRITNFTADRCNASGTVIDDGSYASVKFNWATDKSVTLIKIEWKSSTASTYTSTTVSASGTSGSVSKVIGSGSLDTEQTYDVRVTVTDSLGSSSSEKILPLMTYAIDVRSGGKGIAFGKPAVTDGFNVAWKSTFDDTIKHNGMYVHGVSNGQTISGYLKIARFTITTEWQNSPIKMVIAQRGLNGTCTIYITFSNASPASSSVSHFTYEGDENYQIYITKAEEAVWDLYVKKTEAYDHVGVLEYYRDFEYTGPTVEWTTDFSTTVPGDYIQAQCYTGGKRVTISGWTEGWRYNNGLMIIRRVDTYNATFGQWGSMYSYDLPGYSIPAGTFIDTPSFFIGTAGNNGRDANAMYALNSNGSASKSPPAVIVRPTTSNGSFSVSIIAIGRWKNV